MMIELKITGETAEDIRRNVVALANLAPIVEAPATAPSVDPANALLQMSLDEARDYLVRRFEEEGFAVTFTEKTVAPEPAPEAAPEPEPAPKVKKGRPSALTPEKAVKALKTNGGAGHAVEDDREFVVTTLRRLYDSGGDKTVATRDFMIKTAGQYNVTKVSHAPLDAFPAIRAAMETELAEIL